MKILTDEEFVALMDDDESIGALLITTDTCTKCKSIEPKLTAEHDGFVKYELRRNSSEEAKSLISRLEVLAAPATVLKHKRFTKTTPWTDMDKLLEFLRAPETFAGDFRGE